MISVPGAIRCPSRYAQAKMIDHTELSALFPRKISPTDLDFVIEMRGHMLFGEFKFSDTELPFGQRQCLTKLVMANPKFSAFVASHNVPNGGTIISSVCLIEEAFFWHRGDFKQAKISRSIYLEELCRAWICQIEPPTAEYAFLAAFGID